jgi:hypothetical protein
MSPTADAGDGSRDFDAALAEVERFITDVQRGTVATGEAMRVYRDVHRPAIERLRAQLAEFEALLTEAGVAPSAGQARGEGGEGDEDPDPSSGSA